MLIIYSLCLSPASLTHTYLSLCPCSPLCVFTLLCVLRVGWCVYHNSSDTHCSTLLVHPKGTSYHGKRSFSECFVVVHCVIPPKAHQICVKELVSLEETTPSSIKCRQNQLCVCGCRCMKRLVLFIALHPYGHIKLAKTMFSTAKCLIIGLFYILSIRADFVHSLSKCNKHFPFQQLLNVWHTAQDIQMKKQIQWLQIKNKFFSVLIKSLPHFTNSLPHFNFGHN